MGADPERRELRFQAAASAGSVSAILLRPVSPSALLVLGHGAGAGMRHATMEAIAASLAEAGVATFRYQFPYMERGRLAPSPRGVLLETVRSAVATAAEHAGPPPLLAGGKSMGGRMTSLAASASKLPGVSGLVFFGFPLHGAGRPSTERAAHLAGVAVPTLFLQGTRDKLADPELMRGVCSGLDRSELHLLEGADHSFHVLKRSGLREADILKEAAGVVARWAREIRPSR